MNIERPFLQYVELYFKEGKTIFENLINQPNSNAVKPRLCRDLCNWEWQNYKEECKELNSFKYIRSKIDTHFYLYHDPTDKYWCYIELDTGFVFIKPLLEFD